MLALQSTNDAAASAANWMGAASQSPFRPSATPLQPPAFASYHPCAHIYAPPSAAAVNLAAAAPSYAGSSLQQWPPPQAQGQQHYDPHAHPDFRSSSLSDSFSNSFSNALQDHLPGNLPSYLSNTLSSTMLNTLSGTLPSTLSSSLSGTVPNSLPSIYSHPQYVSCEPLLGYPPAPSMMPLAAGGTSQQSPYQAPPDGQHVYNQPSQQYANSAQYHLSQHLDPRLSYSTSNQYGCEPTYQQSCHACNAPSSQLALHPSTDQSGYLSGQPGFHPNMQFCSYPQYQGSYLPACVPTSQGSVDVHGGVMHACQPVSAMGTMGGTVGSTMGRPGMYQGTFAAVGGHVGYTQVPDEDANGHFGGFGAASMPER
eukprot:1403324-Pleurochrysis_carterae.AAC.1